MAEILVGMSPSNTENLLEEPSLVDPAVAGVTGSVEPDEAVDPAEPSAEEMAIARELVRSARARGVAMTGPGGMLKALTKTVIETALDEELTEHLGYDKHPRHPGGVSDVHPDDEALLQGGRVNRHSPQPARSA